MLTLATLVPLLAHAQPSTRQISLPNQDYTESTEDLVVKVLGGRVVINRTWTWGRWYLNDKWADLILQPDPMGGVLAINRADRIYTRVSGAEGGSIYSFNENNYIRAQSSTAGTSTSTPPPSGWQWYDREGNTIDYDSAGRMLGWANAAGVKVTLVRDDHGRITGVKDHHGRQVISINYNGSGQPIKVSDTAGRSVSYEWASPGGAAGFGRTDGSIGFGQLTKVTDVRGGTWSYTYTPAGHIQTRTDPVGGKIELTYLIRPSIASSSGAATSTGSGGSGGAVHIGSIGSTKITTPAPPRVGSFKDEMGAVTNYRVDYDRVKREYRIGIQLPSGTSQSLRYDARGRLIQDILDGFERMRVNVDSRTQERITDARGLTTTIQYDAARRPVKTIHPDGSSETSSYDGLYNRKTRHTNVLGIVSTWNYDAKGNVITWVEAVGKPEQRTTTYTYDQWGQMSSRTMGSGDAKGPDAITIRYDHDDKGNVIKVTDGLNRPTQAAYNIQGLPTTQTNALNQTTRLDYDAAGNLTSITNPLNETVSHTYDGRGRRTQSTTAEGRIHRTRYNAAGKIIELIAPEQTQGHGTRADYDNSGRPVKIIGPSGIAMAIAYDSHGRVAKATDPAGNAVTYEYGPAGSPLAGLLNAVNYPTYKETYQYDPRGRQTSITQILSASQSRVRRQAYDANGQRISATDPRGNSTLYQYDALGRWTQTIDSLGGVTKHTWSALDDLTSLQDAKGNTHKFEHDKAGQLSKETSPMEGAIRYAYDQAGRLTQRTDAAGNTRNFSYNQAGRLTLEEHKLSGSSLDQRISYSHDKDGQLKSYEQKDGSGALISSALYTRDAQGRRSTSAITYGKVDNSGSFSFQIGQSFDSDGQLASHTYPDGSTQTYSYQNGRLTKVTLPNGSEISYVNFSWRVPGQISTPGATKTLTYDPLQRPTSIEVKSQATGNQTAQVLMSRVYQYDPAGDITQIKSDLGQTEYGYDKLSRLTQATPDQSLQALGLPNEMYSYDAAHNRTSSGHQPGSWVYNGDNQLSQYPRTVPFQPGTQPLQTQASYTPQGHPQKETSAEWEKNYHYNAAERLIKYVSTNQGQNTPQLEAHYRYDPFGRRIAKSVKEGSSQTTYFLYSEQGLMGEADETGKLTKAYGFNPTAMQQRLWSTDPIWQANVQNGRLTDSSSQIHYLHTDHLATPQLATSKTGAIAWKAISEAFGAAGVIQSQSSITMNLRFPGQYFDRETGSHYNLNRDYRPNQARYTQPDPIGLNGGWNKFVYVENNGLVGFDPEGLIPADASANIMDIHWRRNELNKPPKTTEEAVAMGWIMETESRKMIYHRMGKGNEYNTKWTSKDGRQEAVFCREGYLLSENDINRGTYNYFPSDYIGGIPHFFADILPYLIFGNDPGEMFPGFDDRVLTTMYHLVSSESLDLTQMRIDYHP